MSEINNIIEKIYRDDEYNNIIKKIISVNKQKSEIKIDEIWSEIAICYLQNPDKIVTIWEMGYFKYYFAATAKNIIHSSTSPYAKKIRIVDNPDSSFLQDIADSDLQDKLIEEENIEKIKTTMDQIKCSYFDAQMFRMYYFENLSYRDIERETGVDHSTVYASVQKLVKKIKQKIRQNDKKYI